MPLLVTGRIHKKRVIAVSSADVEYRDMVHTSLEILWIFSLLQEFGFLVHEGMLMYCNNQATIFLINPPL